MLTEVIPRVKYSCAIADHPNLTVRLLGMALSLYSDQHASSWRTKPDRKTSVLSKLLKTEETIEKPDKCTKVGQRYIYKKIFGFVIGKIGFTGKYTEKKMSVVFKETNMNFTYLL